MIRFELKVKATTGDGFTSHRFTNRFALFPSITKNKEQLTMVSTDSFIKESIELTINVTEA